MRWLGAALALACLFGDLAAQEPAWKPGTILKIELTRGGLTVIGMDGDHEGRLTDKGRSKENSHVFQFEARPVRPVFGSPRVPIAQLRFEKIQETTIELHGDPDEFRQVWLIRRDDKTPRDAR